MSNPKQSANEKYATVEIMRYSDNAKPTYQTIWISESDWKSINYVDYIEVNARGYLMPEFADSYSFEVCANMLAIVNG